MRILLCDDHRLLVEAFAAALQAHGHEVVAMTTTPEEGCRAVLEHDPDVCVLDLMFPDGSGLDAAARIAASSRCKVLMLSGRAHPDAVTAALAAGAAGFVLKDQSIDGVLRALDRLAAGEVAVDRDLLRAAIRAKATPSRPELTQLRFLTPREREALRRIAEGQNTREIAQSMHVAHSTARTHVQNVLTKLGVRSRLQAAALVARVGLPEAPDGARFVPAPRAADGDRISVNCGRPAPPARGGAA
jgi:DNA-binding NarL/FixJ family response regulator